ncbi:MULTISPECIES: Ada metal-binding domain-containing protein [Bacillaceae]|uniref:HTH araC/xylS-type domain-containing protein n=1 Tax=Alkalicoccobacillus plakortidis TaxID=444060 RepID=A0A9D5DMV8_9BACI|nr:MULTISPECIES: Ada metal-binding domain-containing protein [Bacillaceae]KQL56987.1 hypothetical protein AN965_11035 [Alkalicoccobacillus plakortidis]
MIQEEWQAIKNNNKCYDGYFYYALTTTKTICRPSCTSRTPNPKHVRIFKEVSDALKVGFRPCNRCKPNLMQWRGYKEEISNQTKLYIETHFKEKYSLKNMSDTLKKNPHYIQRCFKEINGITPLNYLHKLRVNEAKQLLSQNYLSIIEIALEVGYNDSTQFSVRFKEHTGVTPTMFRDTQ